MVADPANWQNQGIAGAVGRTLAAFLAPSATPLVSQISQARIAAQPDEAKLLSLPDPYGELAANPDKYLPLARSMILNGSTPSSVAEARLKGAQAAFTTAQGKLAEQAGAPMPSMYGAGGIDALASAGPTTRTHSTGVIS